MSTPFAKGLAALAIAALAASAGSAAWAHGSRARVGVGVHFGVPLAAGYWGPYWGPAWGPGWGAPPVYYDPYYYAPRVAAPPPVYIERPTPEASAYWYWCADPQGYYPTVRTCPNGWQQVAPQPPASR